MPTYEFRCPQGHEFEKFYRTIGTAEAQAVCPECGLPAERMMSASGFAFKGSGFYLTDYGKNAHRDKGTPSPASPASAEGSKSDGARQDGAKSDGAAAGGSKPESAGGAGKGEASKSDASGAA